MSEIQNITNYVIARFDENPLVNTITNYESDMIDSNQVTVYPVVNIDYTGSTIQEDNILGTFQITVLDQLDIYTKSTDSKLKVDTNYFDVINETFAICQRFINSFRKYNNSNIEINSVTDLTPIKNDFINGLSGHEFEIALSHPNNGSSCL